MELVELPLIARGMGLEDRGADPTRLAALDADVVRGAGEDYLSRTRVYRKTDAPRFIDKMPMNWANIGLIALALPNARIVDVRRAPLASCVSAFYQLFAQGQAYSYDLSDLGHYYRDYVRFMDHVDTVLPGRVHRVVYEDLVDDPEAEIRALLAACGLDLEPACLAFHANDRPVWTPSAEQVRRPIYRESIDRGSRIEPRLDALKAALGGTLHDWRGA